MATPTALLDACVLDLAALRDILLHLAGAGLFRARWTDRIHDEWTTNLLNNRPDLDPTKVRRTRRLMNEAILDSLIIGYESLIGSFGLPDSGDEHVLATAVRGYGGIIVTTNTRHFPPSVLRSLCIEARHPDEFIMSFCDMWPDIVLAAIKLQRSAMSRPRVSPQQMIESLEGVGLRRTAAFLVEHAKMI